MNKDEQDILFLLSNFYYLFLLIHIIKFIIIIKFSLHLVNAKLN